MTIKALNHSLEVRLSARWPWTHFKVHRYEYYKHLVWGKLSVVYGQPHLMPMRVCTACYEEVSRVSAGDESWDYCESCQQVEGDTTEITTEEYEAHHA